MTRPFSAIVPAAPPAGEASPLSRLDPRVKLLALLLLLAATFSARDARALLVLAAAGLMLACGGGYPLSRLLRQFASLRLLLASTILLYLLLFPGRTLAGVAWLSLDGLLQGLFVASQLVLALGWSQLLTGTTPALELARGLEWLASPLGRCGLPVNRMVAALALVLYFLDYLRAQSGGWTPPRGDGTAASSGWSERLAARARWLALRLELLLAHADEVAISLVLGRPPAPAALPEPVHRRFGLPELGLALGTVAVCALVWGGL